jgi:hypothetical protein
MHPVDLNLATQTIGYARFLFVRLPPGSADAALGAALDNLGAEMENIHDVDGYPSNDASQRGRYQFLRAEPALSGERDIPHPALLAAPYLIRLEAASPEPLLHYETGLRALIEPRGGTVETLVGVQRPRSYTSHAMTQYAYAHALPPRPGTQLPLGVVTPMNKTAAWWAMDWMRRESFFLPRYDAQGDIIAKGHALVADAGISCITRRNVHHPDGYDRQDGYDFIGYFEFTEADMPTFRAVMAGLRDVTQNPEWAYVREGPEWWGHRVKSAQALWEK